MKKLWALLFSLILLVQAHCLAATPLMPVEDIRAGMRGYAKTVITGDTIESFPVEILGVTGSETQGYQILIKASGSVMERSGGIAQGMSGSPVYIDGRLAGAIAYGKAFTDSRYCFLTPIENMLKLLDKPVQHYEGLVPKSTPLMAGGFTQVGFEYLQQQLQSQGMTALNAGGAGTNAAIGPIMPGSSVAVSLVNGDLTVGALGTVTWTDANGNILAFGHPFLQRGDAGFVMNKAWVLASLPNYQTAYKVGSIGEAIGTFNQDRSAGIAGKIGRLPRVIPMFVAVTDASRSNNGSARVQIVEDEVLAPALVGTVALNTASKVADHAAGGSARVVFDITALDSKQKEINLHRENMYYSNSEIAKQLNGELVEAVTVLLQNKFEKVDILSINTNIEMDTGRRAAEIKSASVVEGEAAPGSIIHINVELKPFRTPAIKRTVTYRLPEKAEGKVQLAVRGGANLNWVQALLRQQKAAGVPAAGTPQKATPQNLRSYVDKLNQADRNNDIIIEIAPKGAKAGVTKAQEAAQAVNLAALVEEGNNKQKTAMDFIVQGETTVTVKVK